MGKTSVKAIAVVLATICAVSAGATAITAGALSENRNENTAVSVRKAENFEIVIKACDWNYSADSLCVEITCDFDYVAKTAKFTAVGKKAGITNAVLKVKAKDGKWNNIPMTFTVDDNLNVTGRMSGEPFVTER